MCRARLSFHATSVKLAAMKVQPGIHPHEMPRNTGSHGEIEVYNSLKSGLPGSWHAWHSLRVMDGGSFGEGDSVIAAPGRGLLVLEVKGGIVEQRDGRWFQNGVAMKRAPRSQAYEFVGKLVRRLERAGCSPPAYCVGTCFPDVLLMRLRMKTIWPIRLSESAIFPGSANGFRR
jgi:hypothetical protein